MEIRWIGTSPQHLTFIRFMVSENGDWTDATKNRGPIQYMISAGCSHKWTTRAKNRYRKMFAKQQWDESTLTVQSSSHCKMNCKMIVKSCRHCKTAAHASWNYRARPSRYVTSTRAHIAQWPLKSCLNRTDIARCLHQAGTIPARPHLPTPNPAMPCYFEKMKMFNSALDCLRSPQQQQLSQLPSCRPRRIVR